MLNMETVKQLEVALNRFQSCPLNLFRVNLDIFLSTLDSDIHLTSLVTDICKSHEVILGDKTSTFVKNVGSSAWTDLKDFNSASLMAAFCYRLCQCLLDEPSPIVCGKNALAIGYYYGGHLGKASNMSASDSISVFSDLFMQPLVAYLRSASEVRHQILVLLSRYRQRSEWFKDRTQVEQLQNEGVNLEKGLKMDFLCYLFDNDISFSIEAETPSGGGEVDVLAVLPELGALPIEVKVFDGKKRGVPYITRGLAQTCEYARKFNCYEAYYIVYNVAENTTLSFEGGSIQSNVIRIPIASYIIHSIVIDLRITLAASLAKNLLSVNIQLPEG